MPDTPEYLQQALQVQERIKAEFQDNGFDENREKTGLFTTDYPNIEPDPRHPNEALRQASGQADRNISDLFVIAAALSPKGTNNIKLYCDIANITQKPLDRIVRAVDSTVLTPKTEKQRIELLWVVAEFSKQMLAKSMQEPSQV